MRIFIAGCGRSGTKVLRIQMQGLADSLVLEGEHDFTALANVYRGIPHAVVKRTASSHLTLHELPSDIRLLYCVRHPFDALTSPNPTTVHLRPYHITPTRWLEEYRGLGRLEARQPRRDICFVRYEDLVSDPPKMQERIAAFLPLPFAHPFGTHATLFTTSIHKWKMDSGRRAYLEKLPADLWPPMTAFAGRFEYDLTLA